MSRLQAAALRVVESTTQDHTGQWIITGDGEELICALSAAIRSPHSKRNRQLDALRLTERNLRSLINAHTHDRKLLTPWHDVVRAAIGEPA